MPSFKRQREIVDEKRDKMLEYQRKVEEQESVVRAHTTEVQAFNREKGHLTRQLGLLEVRYEEALAMLESHEQRLARSGKSGANGEFERNLRREVNEKLLASREANFRVRAIEKTADKAEKSEQKAQERLNELQRKFSEATAQLRTEHGNLIRWKK